MDEIHVPPPQETTDKARLRSVQSTISLWKNGLVEPDEAERNAASATELENKARELIELQEVLKSRDEKLAEAQKAQACAERLVAAVRAQVPA